jgi:hypothetical protein
MAPSIASNLAHIQEINLQRLQGGRTSAYFAFVVAAIIVIFALAHWLHHLSHRLGLRNTSFGKLISTWSIPLRRSLSGSKVYGVDILPDRVALAFVYFGLNIGVSIWDIDWHHCTIFANRLGWYVSRNYVLTR